MKMPSLILVLSMHLSSHQAFQVDNPMTRTAYAYIEVFVEDISDNPPVMESMSYAYEMATVRYQKNHNSFLHSYTTDYVALNYGSLYGPN